MKRMIAAILVLCMVLCSIPVAAAASFDEFFADVPATVENDASYPFAESDDETCLISGNKGMGGTTSALKLTFRSGGTFRFSYKVSSESKYDYMAVTKNGTDLTKSNATSYSGAMTSFQTYTMEVAANDVVTIGYSKDYSSDRNDDTLYLKDFSCKTYYGVTFTGAPAGTAFTLTDSADASYAVTDGKASVPAGEYRYTAEAFGYAQATGSFTVTDTAVEVPVTMTELARHKAAFSITGLAAGTTAAVTVKHGDEVMQAEEDGSYLLFPADYSYQVKAAGYKTARGTFTLGEADTTVKVTMVPGIEWDGTVADGFAGGTGTQADPYLISNGEELAYLSAQVASGNAFAGKYVTLAANLDMGNVAFTPIGSDARRFAGSFDGAYHTIDNLLVSQTTDYAGLFGCLDTGAAVRRLTVRGSISGRGYVGGIAGQADSATIEACANYATVTGTSRNVGGIVGRLNGKSAARSTVLRCANFGTISNGTNNFSAGIVGTAYYTTLSECYNVGSATGNRVGGILGQTDSNTTVTSCYNAGAITLAAAGNYNYAGSLIGYNDGGSVSNCYYLTGMQAIGRGSGDTTALTEEQLKSLDTVLKLGGAFVNDAKNQNSGYPVLAWQDADAKLIVAFSVNMTGASVHVYDAQNVEQTPEEDGTYRLVSGSYTYLVTRDECDDVTGSFTIDGAGRTITVTLSVRTYPVSVTLTPAEAKLVLRDADGKQWSAVNGAWRLPKGSYTYEASLFGYETAAGSLTVTGENDSLSVTLQQAARHSVRISTVKADDGSTLSGADITVTHAEGGEQTAMNGVYSLPDGTYSYTVMLDGYLNVAGSFTVAGKDLTVTVRLEEGSNVWTGKASDTAPETKTENGVTWYLIKTPEELAWFAAKVNGGETTINARIMVNLVLNSTEAPKANRWGGIGKYSAQFGGILDGNGKTISGYYSCDNDATYESASALSGYLGADGVIKNVTLVGMIEGNGAIGAFANQSYGRIEGCVSRVNVTNAASYGGVTGGIAARVYASGAIVNCGNEGSVTCTLSSAYSDAKVGGIVGASYAPITGCYNTGAINGGSNNRGYVGGIVGYTENGSVQILNCYNTGSVTGATCAGGIAGKHTGGTDPTVTNCYNTGSVKGASCGALVGEYAAEIRNSYYLEGSASAATGNTKDGVNVEATAKTAAEMKETAFVLALGNEAFHQDDGRNGGYPLLAWQGGTHVVNTAAAEAIARAAEKLTVEPTLVTENCTLALASTVEGFDGTITWASSNGAVITPEGVVTLPSAGTVYVKLTATLAYGGETGTKTFLITVKSLKAQNDELVTAAKSLLDSKSTLNPAPGTDTNLCTYVENYLSRNNLDGITVTVKDPGALDYPMDVAQTTGIAADGKITYFNADPATLGLAAHFARVSGVELTLTRGESSADITAMVILNWDLDTVRDYLEKAAASVTFDTIRNQNTSEAEIISDLQLPQRTGAYPFVTFAWTSDSKLISIEGSTAGEVLTGRVTRPSVDTKVHLYPTLTFQLNESSLQAEGFRLTLPAEDLEPLRQQMQKELDENYLVTKLTYVVTGEVIDPEAVNGDIQLLTARATGIENYDDYKFIVTSGNPDVAEINAYRANIYRPMPGEAAAEVTLTVTMQHKTKDVSVQKQIALKVLPLTKAELDDALNLMEQVKAHYWDGLNDGANESQYAVTKSLHAFREAVAGENGGLTWLYDYRDAHGAGIVAGDQADYSSVGGQEQYNKFKSSNPAVIAHENLVLTQPKYNTSVTVESVLEHAVFAKYAKKITSGAWYDDYFSKLTGQKVSATMTVLGTDGPNPGGDQPPVRTTVTVVLTGVNGVGAVDRTFDTTSDKTVAEALQEGLGEDYTLTVSGYGYIGSLTGPDDFNAANAGVEFWGQYYYIDGAYDTSSPLTVPVTDGAVYGIFANEKNTTGENYGYKYNVWIHERSVTVEAETAFDVTVCQMQGNTAVPQAGVKVYADGNVMGVSDENGKVICRFEHAGDYVLTTGDELHTYSQCRVHVTEKPFKATVTVRLTGVNGIGAIDRTLEVSSSSTVAEALQQGFGEDYVLTVSEYGYIGSLTGPEDFNAANAAVAYWGQYYFVNGAYDTSSPLTVPVTAGGIYGVFANESTADSDSYYGYKYNVWFHETALTAAASETFTATVYQMGTGVAPAEGVQIFCGGELLGRTAADGTFAWHFDTAGVYVLTTGDSNHTYSQCVVTVTGKAPVCDGGANCPSRAFPDLDPAQWYHLSTDYAITNHLFIGFEDGTFRPNGQMSRAMFAMVLWRVAGSPASSAALPFADVAADAWYADAVRWAYAAGVINGVSTTAFDPESPVTREQMVTMIVRYAEKIGAVTGARDDLSQFSDGMQVSSYALAAVRWAVAVGLLRGMGNGRLEPQGTATRAEVATLLMRFASLGK